MSSEKQLSRRHFVSKSALTVSGLMLMDLPSAGAPDGGEAVRAAIIGTGSRGQGLASTMEAVPGLQLSACCDVLPERLAQGMTYAHREAKAYDDYRRVLDNQDITAVLIATPLHLHHPMAMDAIDAGKHVYLEKTMTYDIPQTLELVKKVRVASTTFQVGFQYRSFALYHRVKEVIQEGWLGKVMHIECQYNRNSNWRRPVADPKMERVINWRMYREFSGGPLAELCAHQVDAVNYMLDAHPHKVTGMGGIDYWKDGRETYDNIRTLYEYPEGIKCAVTSVLSNAYDGYQIRILGDKTTMEIGRDKVFIYPETTKNVRGVVDGVSGATIKNATQGNAYELEYALPGKTVPPPTRSALEEFGSCITSGAKPISNVASAKDTSIAIHMGNAAAREEKFQYWKKEYSL